MNDFGRCMGYVLQLGGLQEGEPGWDEASLLAKRIFDAFQDSDDKVDFAAIMSGISIICQSSVEEKVCAREERYIRGVSDSLNVTSHMPQCAIGPSPPRQVLVAFTLFDTDADEKFTFEDFAKYMASVLRVVRAVAEGRTGEFVEALTHSLSRYIGALHFCAYQPLRRCRYIPFRRGHDGVLLQLPYP